MVSINFLTNNNHQISIFLFLLLLFGCSKSPEVAKSYHSNGNIRESIEMQNGRVNGQYKVFYEDGTIKTIANYVNDTVDGTVTYYSMEGNIQSQLIYDKGREVLMLGYDELSGRVILYEERSGNLRDGKYFEMDTAGDTLIKARYKKDTLVYHKIYNKRGDVLDIFFDYTIKKEFTEDSIMLQFKILSPNDNVNIGVTIGSFLRGPQSEFADTVLSSGKRGPEVSVKLSKEYFLRTKDSVQATISELDSDGTAYVTLGFSAPLSLIDSL